MRRDTRSHKSFGRTLSDVAKVLPDLDIVIWERKQKSQTFSFYCGTLQNPNIDVRYGECLPSLALRDDEFYFGSFDELIEKSVDIPIVHARTYEKLGWVCGALYPLLSFEGDESSGRDNSIAIVGFLGKAPGVISERELSLIRATRCILGAALNLIIDLDESIERDQRIERNLFSINTSEVAAQYLHDIKDDLNTIVGTASDLRSHLLPHSRPAQVIHNSLMAQIANAQRLSSEFVTQARRNDMTLAMMDFSKLLRRQVGHYRLEARRHNVTFRDLIPPAQAFLIKGDIYRLNSVVANIVSNAIYFVRRTQRSPLVEVILFSDADNIILEVRDNGPGCADSEKPFRIGYSTRPGGTGLGLSISKDIIDRHMGSIAIDSVPGSGTCVRVRLPRAD